MLGVSFDTVEDQKAFADDQGYSFPLLADPDKAVGTQYDVLRDPGEKYADFPQRISYLIAPGGDIVKAYDFNEDREFEQHSERILEDIAALA